MPAECPCQNCNGGITFEPEQAGLTVACPHCGNDTVLFLPLMPAEPEPSPIPVAMQVPIKPQLSPKQKLRNQTQYSIERTIVNWMCGLMTVAAGIGFLAILASTARDVGGNNDYHIDSELVFFSSIACLLSAWIGRAIAHAVFDMADCALKRLDKEDEDF